MTVMVFHRPQQGHDHRRPDGDHGQLQLQHGGREHNAENLLVIRSPELAAKYAANWKVHADHSDPYAGRTEGYSQTHRAKSAKPAEPAQLAAHAAAPVTDGYVASKNSQVFHKAGCKSAAKIAERNLVKYNTREEAIQAWKKPCHECNP